MPSSRGSVCEDANTGASRPRIVQDRYEIVRRLGLAGQDGVAYLARDLRHPLSSSPSASASELRVLKEIRVDQLTAGQQRDLLAEADSLSGLRHLLLAPPLHCFLDSGYYCSVAEYYEEGDLGQALIACKQAGKRLPETQVAAWFVQLCLAVRYLHSRGVIHRNLKSSNIYLDGGRLRLGDLCPSLLMLGHHKATTSIFYGTPHYTSPEVLRHDGVTSQCDLWSLGCVLFEMCHLRYAFDSQSMMGVVYNVVWGKRNPLPSGPRSYGPELLAAVEALLRQEAAERERSVGLLSGKYFSQQLRALRDHLLASDPEVARVLARREVAARAQAARERAAEAARLEEERLLAEVRAGGGRRRGDGDDGDDGGAGGDGRGGGPLVSPGGQQLPYSARGRVTLALACEADWERRMRGLASGGGGGAWGPHPRGPEPMRSDSRLVGEPGVPAGQDSVSRALYYAAPSTTGGGVGHHLRAASSLPYDIGSLPLRTAATPRDGPRRVEAGSLCGARGSVSAADDGMVGAGDGGGSDGSDADSDDDDDDDDADEAAAAAMQPHPGADLVEQIDSLGPLPCVADSVCFTPASRAHRIEQLRRQALARLPADTVDRVAAFLREARSRPGWKEAELQDRLASMHPRLADCFLVDQLVFLEACQRED